MKRVLATLVLSLCVLGGCRHPASAPAPRQAPGGAQQPALKLAILVVLDQLPQWGLDANRARLHPAGFLRGMASDSMALVGAYPYAATLTAVGHTTLVTGALPSAHGVFANSAFDDATGKEQRIFGQPGSPGLVRVPTVFDELKAQGRVGRIVSLSLKDRSAIALGGKHAAAVIWHDHKNHAWMTSPSDGAALPSWVTKVPANFGGVADMSPTARDMASARALFDLADSAIAGSGLGTGELPDILTISVSSLDFAGHAAGVESARYLDVLRAADERMAGFVKGLATMHGFAPGEVMVVLTSDHGSAPLPELRSRPNMAMAWPHGKFPPRHDASVNEPPRGRFDEDAVAGQLQAASATAFGTGHWVAAAIPPYFFLGRDAEALAPDARARLIAFLLAQLRATHGVWRAYEVNAMGLVLPGTTSPVGAADPVDELVRQGVAPKLNADLYAVLSPFWVYSAGTKAGTHHGTPWHYDRAVPFVIWPAFRARGKDPASPVSMTEVAGLFAATLSLARTPGASQTW